MERTMKLYGNRIFGVEVSDYGLENGYLDYLTLSKIVGPCIMNHYLRAETMEDWEIVAGDLGGLMFIRITLSQNMAMNS